MKNRDIPGGVATILAALIGAAAGIIVALISVGFFSNAPDYNAISAPKQSDLWIDQNGHRHRYWAVQGYSDWDKAEAFCEELGGHLVTITSTEEQSHIAEYVRQFAPKGMWIGLKAEYGKWGRWVNGEDLNFTNWGMGYGQDSANASYAVLWNWTFWEVTSGETLINKAEIGQWITLAPDSSYNDGWLICEWEYD